MANIQCATNQTGSSGSACQVSENIGADSIECRQLTVCGGYTGARTGGRCPSLYLQGRWLDRAGFQIGARVHVARGRSIVDMLGPDRD